VDARIALLVFACLLPSCRDKVAERGTGGVPITSAAKPPLLELPPEPANAWIESKRFRLRVLDARPCSETGEEPGGRYRLGVAVEIEATAGADVSPVFASPSGVELEKNGRIFRPLREPAPGCEALLEPTRLAPGQSTRGIVVFDAPEVSYLRSAVLRFKPPRWGKESQVSVQLPDCFGNDCPPSQRTGQVPPVDAADRLAEQVER